jgi:uncharacterized protein (TIGR03663 family)
MTAHSVAQAHDDGRTPSRWPELSLGAALFGLILIFALGVRIWDVGGRVMHLDESTVAWFAWQLVMGHGYAYDPVYHGPFQHEVLAAIFGIFGPSQTSARLLAVVMGTGLVALPWFVRDYLGRAVALWACFLLAISPSFVYFARFERDDTYMEFFTFALVVLALRFLRDRRPWQLYAAVITFALAFATKESIYIVAFIFATYLVFRWAGFWIGRRSWVYPDGPTVFQLVLAIVVRPWVMALGFALPLLLALMVTIRTGLYLPVPAVVMLILIGGVVFASSRYAASVIAHRSLARQRGWMWRRAWSTHWFTAVTIAVGIVIVMYSTFGTNLNGLWDRAHPFFNTGDVCQYPLAFGLDACRKDIVGGLFYWLSQHKVARGGEPWYYFLLIFGLYEQIAILFACIGGAVTFLSRQLRPGQRTFRMFITYWAGLSMLIYSWAGEKFPWLGIHPLLPITLLAAIGIGDLLRISRTSLIRRAALSVRFSPAPIIARVGLAVLGLLLVLEIHNTLTLNFVNAANPVEMMVYVQTAPDVLADANRIALLSHRATGDDSLPISIDNLDTWPLAWYLRNMTSVGYPAGTAALTSRDPIIILDQSDAGMALPKWLTTGYTKSLRRLDGWFPEDYKQWTWSSVLQRIGPTNYTSTFQSIWNWELNRTPFGTRGGDYYYLFIKKNYFPAF